MYALSDAFSSAKSLQKSDSNEEETKSSIFDTMIHSRAWAELNNSAAVLQISNDEAYNSVGYPRYCNPDGSLKEDTIDSLRTMVYYTLKDKILPVHELLLEIQCCYWKFVPRVWFELRA